jgi:hypothetical protein
MLPTKFRFIWPSGFREDFIIKTSMILNIMHIIFDLRDTEVVICIIPVVTRTVSDLTEWYPRLQYYDVQTLEYSYISKLPMKNERIWSYVKETKSHLQNKLTKNIL